MLHKTTGIVLKTTPYNDKNAVVTILTQDFGKIAYDVRGFSSKNAKIRSSIMQPLSCLSLEVNHRENRELQRIDEAHILPFCIHFIGNPIKGAMCHFLAEVIDRTTPKEEKDDPLFQFLKNEIEFFALKNDALRAYHLNFLLIYSNFLGFYPFDKEHNEFIAALNNSDKQLFLKLLDNASLLNKEERNRATELMLKYYQFYLPQMKEIASFSVLTEVFL